MPITEPRTLHFLGLDLPVRARRRIVRRQGERKADRILEPTSEFWVTLETSVFAVDPIDALVAVRAGLGSPARLDDVRVLSMRLVSADHLSFPSPFHPDHWMGRVTLELEVEHASPFPFSFDLAPDDAMPFARALLAADNALGGSYVHLESIQATDDWWLFPTHEIGCLGVVVDRRDPRRLAVLGTGLGGDVDAMLWAFDQRLLDGPCAIVVHRVLEPDRVASAIAEATFVPLADVQRDLTSLPATFRIREDALGVGRLFDVREVVDLEVRPLVDRWA